PRRLLDVGSEIEPVQLVDATTQVPYIALSHCWGKKHLLRTTQETLDSMAGEVPFQNLSPTFQHSVQLTRALGIRHLWIDSLCIVQDDPADWEAEAAKMAAIYTNAILVLSASAASDGEGGFINHSIQSPPRMRQRSLPLFDRAWAYQERLLATRILHFATGEMVWECKEVMACECRLRWTQKKKVEDDAWHLIVTNYSKRLLTFDTDRLPALSGLAKAFSESASGGTYLAGLWSTSLLDDLTWCNTNRQESKYPSTYLAPSWSWVSVAGCV
ncbi:HET-domain-containing protein, partial [Thozetella sp. PMI_491]